MGLNICIYACEDENIMWLARIHGIYFYFVMSHTVSTSVRESHVHIWHMLAMLNQYRSKDGCQNLSRLYYLTTLFVCTILSIASSHHIFRSGLVWNGVQPEFARKLNDEWANLVLHSEYDKCINFVTVRLLWIRFSFALGNSLKSLYWSLS